MKQTLALLLAVLLLLASGCSTPARGLSPQPDGTGTVPDTESVRTTAASAATNPAATNPAATAPVETAAPTEPETEAPAEPPETEALSTEAPSTTPAPTEAVDPWSLMGELFFEQDNYTDENGVAYSYSYGLPCINDDTEGAQAINEDIQDIFGGEIIASKEDMERGAPLFLFSTGYYGQVWKDVLSLIVISHKDYGQDTYSVYCYECSTGRWLSTRDLLQRMGISEQEFLDACSLQFRQFFEEMYKDLTAEQREKKGYNKALERVDDELYVSMDLQAYPTADGDLAVAAPIVSLTGADFYYHILTLGFVGSTTPDD